MKTQGTEETYSQNINENNTSQNKSQDNFEDNREDSNWQQEIQEIADSDTSENPLLGTENTTGLPDDLKANMELDSGLDLSEVRVHYNSALPATMNAHAITKGMNIHIASGAEKYLPEEAAHLLQQLKGQVKPDVSLTNGTDDVSMNVDDSLETDAVQKGKELDKTPTPKTELTDLKKPKVPKDEVVQRATKSSHYGDFIIDDAEYDFNDENNRLIFELEFKPNDDVDATKVGLSQIVKNEKNGNVKALEPNQQQKMTDDGYRIDRLADAPNPIYGTFDLEAGGDETEMGDYEESDTGQYAEKKDGEWNKTAYLEDAPTISGGNNSSKEFETSAIALEGNDKGEYYGSVQWGWKKDGSGVLTKIDFDLVSEGVPSKNFLEAAEKWNSSKARGTMKAKADNTVVYDRDKTTELFQVSKGTKAEHLRNLAKGDTQYNKIKILDGENVDKVGYVQALDFEDSGDGEDTANLPLPGIKVPTEDNLHFAANKDEPSENDPLLPESTRMKIIEEEDDMAKVEIVQGPKTGDQGWVETAKLKDE
ncbi:MAG: DUF4157 domain-containing protein [Saprospiraceae bacterium]|nr:DUF4157 domain-containing protein [Saprospiraceae bacterium]